MPRRDARALLEDVVAAGSAAAAIAGRTNFEGYVSDMVIRSAIERQLMIVGEAVARLRDLDRSIAERLGPVESIVGFRNILVHGYHMVNHEVVWRIASEDAPEIVARAAATRAGLGAEGTPTVDPPARGNRGGSDSE
ncbi:MAG: DUF86 domain-containing protein [Phycisphaerales bacterium]